MTIDYSVERRYDDLEQRYKELSERLNRAYEIDADMDLKIEKMNYDHANYLSTER